MMKFFKNKNAEKITELETKIVELETKIVELEQKLDRANYIRVGDIDFRYMFKFRDNRPKIGIAEAIQLLIKHQGLELKHTSSSEKTELVAIKKDEA